MTAPHSISPGTSVHCAVCGKPCKWVNAEPDEEAPSKFGGAFCSPCDTFTETDVEVED
jgi:hypothetical protein